MPGSTRTSPATRGRRRSAKIYEEYQRRLTISSAMDFDDLIMRTVEIFDRFPDVLKHYQERFAHVLVDEFQDTNLAQARLATLLAGKWRNIFVVGDADQGIYAFRGATIKNLLDFERDWPDAQVITLEQNYRSTQNDPVGRERGDREQRDAQAEVLVDRIGRGGVDHAVSRAERARRGRLGRRRDRATEGARLHARRRGGLLSDERTVPRPRGDLRAARRSPTRSSVVSGSTSAKRSRTCWPGSARR